MAVPGRASGARRGRHTTCVVVSAEREDRCHRSCTTATVRRQRQRPAGPDAVAGAPGTADRGGRPGEASAASLQGTSGDDPLRKLTSLCCAVVAVAGLGLASCSNSKEAVSTEDKGAATRRRRREGGGGPARRHRHRDPGRRGRVDHQPARRRATQRRSTGSRPTSTMVNEDGGIYGRKLVLAPSATTSWPTTTAEVAGPAHRGRRVRRRCRWPRCCSPAPTRWSTPGMPTFGWNINAEWAGTPEDPRPTCSARPARTSASTAPRRPAVRGPAGDRRHKVGVLAYNVAAVGRVRHGRRRQSFEKYGDGVDAEIVYMDKPSPTAPPTSPCRSRR